MSDVKVVVMLNSLNMLRRFVLCSSVCRGYRTGSGFHMRPALRAATVKVGHTGNSSRQKEKISIKQANRECVIETF